MTYIAEVIADSITPSGQRLTTFEVEYPHAIHKDVMTHRKLSRNFQSFRAFPPEKVIEKIREDPFIPEVFNLRVAGMGRGEAIHEQEDAYELWDGYIEDSIWTARKMLEMNIAKEQINFILQDLTWIRGIVSATSFDNFFALRLAKDQDTGEPLARPEVHKIASMMKGALEASQPQALDSGQWHLPLVRQEDREQFGEDYDTLKKLSTGRCARSSYLTHNGIRDPEQDVRLHNDLLGDGHMSPFEHPATPMQGYPFTHYPPSNFDGWQQYRKTILHEDNFALLQAA